MRGSPLVFVGVLLAAGALNAQTPTVSDNGVLNGASFERNQAVAPGSLVSIFGDNLATSLASASSVPLSTSLGGVSVTFGGVSAPLRDVIPGSASSRSQVNAQIPWDVLSGQLQGSVPVVVTRAGVSSAPQQVQLTQAVPGIFTIPPGRGNAIAINADGTVAAPVGSIQGIQCRPARRGEAIFFYATGLGPVDFPVNNGADSLDRLRSTQLTFTVVIDGIPVTPAFTGLSPQFPGVNQVNFVVPQGTRSGIVPLQLQYQATLFPPASDTPAVTIAVE